MQGCIPFLSEGRENASHSFFQESFQSAVFYSIHVHVPVCGKAEGKTNYPTGVFSIPRPCVKTLDMIMSITYFHRL